MRRIIARSGCSEEGFRVAVEVLERGGLVIYPTDTTYGLAADAENREAVLKVYRVKVRPRSNPLTIAVSDFEMMARYAVFDERLESFMREFLPGAVTFVLPKTERVPDEVNPRAVGVRIPDNPIAIELVRRFGRAVTATSANISGRPPAYTPEEAMMALPDADLIIDAGPLPRRPASTVVDLTSGRPELVRRGPVPFEDILKKFQEVVGGA
ncbi:MAG: threonylcarbamoyl-AMP synthase [Thermoproteota archaeon]|nr:MAG: threonylcarbamoyl-AMP synthase [Candidatus Korarchaeota archaeon]